MPQRPVRILHITDPHLHAHRDAMMRGLNTYKSFKSVISHVIASERRADAVIATGDLVQDETRQGYERFRKVLGPLGVPVHSVPGNHDAPRIMAEILNQQPFQHCGTAIYEDWCLIMLNTVVRGEDGGILGPKQVEILKRTLGATSAHHVLIAMHHHPIPMGSQWLDGIGLHNNDEFFAIVEQHSNVRGILWGHVHQASDREHKGIAMMSTPSTGAQFLPNSDGFMMDTRPPGYRWLNLMPDGAIETEVVWLP